MAESRFHFPEKSIPSMPTLSAFCSPDNFSCAAHLSELYISLRKDLMERKRPDNSTSTADTTGLSKRYLKSFT